MIHVKNTNEIERMRVSGRVNAMIHDRVASALAVGVSTGDLNLLAADLMKQSGVRSSFHEFMGFPGHICVSLNDETGHSIPNHNRVIQSGDVVKIDIGVECEGMHTDCATTHVVGQVDLRTRYLIDVTESALTKAIALAVRGNRLSDLSHTMSSTVERSGFSIVRRAFGHGIGSQLHEEPLIPNFGLEGYGPRLRPGMTIAVEPVVASRSHAIMKSSDGWTDTTLDGGISSHFEHTLLITEDNPEVLTAPVGKANGYIRNVGDAPFIRVRQMDASDQKDLVTLACSQMDPILMEAWGRRVNPREIFGENAAATVLVLETEEGEIAGFFVYTLKTKSLFLNTLIVSPKYQGTGVASDVMLFLEAEAEVRGLWNVELAVQTTNHRAMRFYEKRNFEPLGSPYPNTIVMRKRLSISQ